MTREEAEAFLGLGLTNAPFQPPTDRFSLLAANAAATDAAGRAGPMMMSPPSPFMDEQAPPPPPPPEAPPEYNPRFINRFSIPRQEPPLPRVEEAPYWSRSPLVQNLNRRYETAADRYRRRFWRGAEFVTDMEALPRTLGIDALRRTVVDPAIRDVRNVTEGISERAKPVMSWFDQFYQTQIKPPPLYLTPEQARSLLMEAGGDKERARQLARERGYEW